MPFSSDWRVRQLQEVLFQGQFIKKKRRKKGTDKLDWKMKARYF